jgi:hypothetical protein
MKKNQQNHIKTLVLHDQKVQSLPAVIIERLFKTNLTVGCLILPNNINSS